MSCKEISYNKALSSHKLLKYFSFIIITHYLVIQYINSRNTSQILLNFFKLYFIKKSGNKSILSFFFFQKMLTKNLPCLLMPRKYSRYKYFFDNFLIFIQIIFLIWIFWEYGNTALLIYFTCTIFDLIYI